MKFLNRIIDLFRRKPAISVRPKPPAVKSLPLVEFTYAPTFAGRMEILRGFYESNPGDLAKTTLALVAVDYSTGKQINVHLGSPTMLILDSSKWVGYAKAREFEAKSSLVALGLVVLNGSFQAISPRDDGIMRFASGGQFLNAGDCLRCEMTMNVSDVGAAQ